MAAAEGSLEPSPTAQARGSALVVVVFLLVAAAPAFAQQPLFSPAPQRVEFLPRYDFHLSVDSLMPPKDTPEAIADERFSWDTDFGGSFDVLDVIVGRAGATINFEAVEGSEYRPFDPNQGNYTLEGFILARVSTRTEFGAIFHHVSRHLSDRAKREAIAWNELGGRALTRFDLRGATVDLDLEGGWAVQHSFVDYTWIGESNVLVRHSISPRVGIFAHGNGKLFGVRSERGTQLGVRVEAGVRLGGRGGVMELYLGYENRVDAYPFDRVSQRWGLAGLRLVSR